MTTKTWPACYNSSFGRKMAMIFQNIMLTFIIVVQCVLLLPVSDFLTNNNCYEVDNNCEKVFSSPFLMGRNTNTFTT